MVTIKRYPNRKLYDTEARQYITLEGIAGLIRQGKEIRVIDNLSGEDLTALTLTQIIMEQERKQDGFLSDSFLIGLIRAGGDRLFALQRHLPSPHSLLRQVDDEIQRRIQALVHARELSEQEGRLLLEKLLGQTARLSERLPLELLVEKYLFSHQVPPRDDLEKLSHQLDDLSARLAELSEAEDTPRTHTQP